MVITDLPVKILGLDMCAACVAKKSVHLSQRHGQAGKYPERVHIKAAGPMPVTLAGGREYVYVVVDDYTEAVYTRPLRLKLGQSKGSKHSGWQQRMSLGRGSKRSWQTMCPNYNARDVPHLRARRHQAALHSLVPPYI